nr:hypothetical transcript [Hymenolepis microstoma]
MTDRSRSSNSTTEPMDESGSTPLSPGCELTPPHLIPKAKNLASQRLEFSGKPILNNNKYLLKQRPRRLSGHFPQSIDINASLSPLDFKNPSLLTYHGAVRGHVGGCTALSLPTQCIEAD